MSSKVLVVYYTQTGQLRDIVNSFTAPLAADPSVSLFFEEIRPSPSFPFPWTSDTFFQAMPESVQGIPCKLEPLSLSGNENFDLIIVAWQPWFLSPSIPTHALFQHEIMRRIMKGKPVVTLVGSRNMWIMAHEEVKQYIRDAGGRLAGNVVLYDKAPNLLSVISIIRWMFSGKKDRFLKVFPPAGIAQDDIANSASYGRLVLEALKASDFEGVRARLVEQGAVEVFPSLLLIEKRGKIFFRIWARFILRKGSYGNASRIGRVRLFKYYLLAVLYLVSPLVTLIFHLTRPFRKHAIKKQISLYQLE